LGLQAGFLETEFADAAQQRDQLAAQSLHASWHAIPPDNTPFITPMLPASALFGQRLACVIRVYTPKQIRINTYSTVRELSDSPDGKKYATPCRSPKCDGVKRRNKPRPNVGCPYIFGPFRESEFVS
jgi:hypothetical protein